MSPVAAERRRVHGASIPARTRSTRLPGKPLADIARQAHGGAGSRSARRKAAPRKWSSRPTTRTSRRPSRRAAAKVVHDPPEPCDRHRPPRRGASTPLKLARRRDRRQRAGRRAAHRSRADPRGGRELAAHPEAAIATAAHPIDDARDVLRSQRGEGGARRARATRSTSAARRSRTRATRSRASRDALPAGLPVYRHIGIYAYRVRVPARATPRSRRRPSSASRRWSSCARWATAIASRSPCGTDAWSRASIPRRTSSACAGDSLGDGCRV